MAETLKDPGKPAHEIVEVYDDGSALRNDGLNLRSARKNPWYVLATIYGEHEAGASPWEWAWDDETVSKNRRAWNGWACARMAEAQRASLAKEMELDASELRPLSKQKIEEIQDLFRERMDDENAELPDPRNMIIFEDTYFEKPVKFSRCVFPDTAKFESATFTGNADFEVSTFTGAAFFEAATFACDASFASATFSGYASFLSTIFTGDADFAATALMGNAVFNSAKFTGNARFLSATFTSDADFSDTAFIGNAFFISGKFTGCADFWSATFTGAANFDSATFNNTTVFDKAIFETHVPTFFGADLYAATRFEVPDTAAKRGLHWPPLTGDPGKIMSAKDQKRAYNRLRLFMNQSLQTEEEQFFHRREMGCKKVLALQKDGEGWFMFAVYWLYGLLSDYGHSVGRPLGWLVGNVGVGGIWFWTYLWWYHQPISAWSAVDALGISFANVFPFFGFGRRFLEQSFYQELDRWATTFAGAQTITGFILLFLLGLGLRSRFRLR